jgi:hypothetical protein
VWQLDDVSVSPPTVLLVQDHEKQLSDGKKSVARQCLAGCFGGYHQRGSILL